MADFDQYVTTILTSVDKYQRLADTYANAADDILYSYYIEFGITSFRPNDLRDLTFIGETDLVNNAEQYKDIVDLRNEFEGKYNQLLTKLENSCPTLLNQFINNYFPKPQNFDTLEQFLVNSVNNGSIGLPPEVEQQIWEQDRERNLVEAQRVIVDQRKSIAARGFIEPTGVEAYRELLIQNEVSKKISASSRNIAVESAKLKIEWVKFAVQEARNYRTLAIESAFKYLQYVLSANDPAFKYASGYVDSYKTFYDTIDTYFGAVNNINRLKFERANALDTLDLEGNKFYWQQHHNIRELQQQTALELVRSMSSIAQSATSAMNVVGTLATTATA